MEKIQFPPIDSEYETCILWLPPSDPNCRLLLVTMDFLLSWQPNDDEFVRKDFDIEIEYTNWYDIIVYKGKIYAIIIPR